MPFHLFLIEPNQTNEAQHSKTDTSLCLALDSSPTRLSASGLSYISNSQTQKGNKKKKKKKNTNKTKVLRERERERVEWERSQKKSKNTHKSLSLSKLNWKLPLLILGAKVLVFFVLEKNGWLQSWRWLWLPVQGGADRRLGCGQVQLALQVHSQRVQPRVQVHHRGRVRHSELECR